ncbi:SDR family NAD(P)-dependent oxidoreductase [Kordiimonas marina]|uniref:SDR family NAD(P)-dependent oxidoreductase n=1 Tax=Kordiimonas marina TaxID=2872312 RepID=UPI001FF5A91F|nr:SDR family oxidoreductase [Kordiimonas marina]MCJ9429201.1 SDR family oxidoreductase [Kordiimonas marina]
MFTLEGQTILVTGASRGIGAATAQLVLELGGTLVGSYQNAPGKLDTLQAEYGADRVLSVQVNLGEKGAGKRLWQEAMAFKGRIDGLVNNAGIAPETPIDADDEVWDKDWADVIAVNLQAVADLCRAAVLAFKKQGGGRIVTVASRAAFRGDIPECLHYAASKGALVAMMRSIARAYAKDGIYGFIIAPGWVKTDMATGIYEPGNEYKLQEIPMGDAAPAEEVGNMITFLLSGKVDNATGATFDINGASYVR